MRSNEGKGVTGGAWARWCGGRGERAREGADWAREGGGGAGGR